MIEIHRHRLCESGSSGQVGVLSDSRAGWEGDGDFMCPTSLYGFLEHFGPAIIFGDIFSLKRWFSFKFPLKSQGIPFAVTHSLTLLTSLILVSFPEDSTILKAHTIIYIPGFAQDDETSSRFFFQVHSNFPWILAASIEFRVLSETRLHKASQKESTQVHAADWS